jgi:thioredoxin:protein disulfide reductase
MIKHVPWLLVFCVVATLAAPEEELLPPDQAFQLTTTANATTLEATWRVAPGYYLYRDKFKFEALDPALRFKLPLFPPGKIKEDPYFGRSEIYIGQVTVKIPFVQQSAANTARIRITAQGCNEPIGVCYPPITKELTLALAPDAVKPDALLIPRIKTDTLRAMGLSSSVAEAVDPEQAFRVDAMALDAHTLGVRLLIADCCYLYRDKTRFVLSSPDGKPLTTDLRLGAIAMPDGEVLTDEYVGRTEVYRRGFDLRLPLLGAQPTSGFALNVSYQGCADQGTTICYEPTTRRFPIANAGGVLAIGVAQEIETGTTAAAARAALPARDRSRGTELLLAMLGAFGAGLLLTFTPCVLPMIPIVSSALVGAEGARLTKLRGGLLSYTYVLGTALTYTVAGAIAGATGEQLQAYFQNPWAIGIFSGLLALFALSMFGLYEVHMPHAIQSFLHHHSTRVRDKAKRWVGGEFIGVFALGAFSALIIGACVTPVLASWLGAAIVSKDPVQGAAIMFALANGQGAIIVAIGISEGLLLPRSGPWMNTVKHVSGVLLLAVAIYLLSALQDVPVLLLWGALFIICGVYLGATQALPKEASGWQQLWKGIGTLLLVWGVLALVGGFAGGRDVFRPLSLDLAGTSLPV